MNLDKILNLNYLWGALIVEELVRHGIDYFCIAPGSRSAPLAGAVASNPKARSFIHFDERGLAFHALGFVSATGKPAVVISTSGTAVANFSPAVVEASKRKLPLIVLTADRPPELRKTGADQTIDQPGIFGEYVRWQMDLPCPDPNIKPSFVLTTIDQAVYRATSGMAGPVHVNCMFREPLAPVKTAELRTADLQNLRFWKDTTQPYTRYLCPQKSISAHELKNLAATLNKIRQGVIVVGKLSTPQEREAVVNLSEKLNWPVLADITSGLRLGSSHPQVIHYFDHILLSDRILPQIPLEGVLHLGGRITSKRWYQAMEKARPRPYITVLNHPLRNDPLHQVSLRVEMSVADFAEGLLGFLRTQLPGVWLKQLQGQSNQIDRILEKFVQKQKSLSEPLLARLISQHIPADSGLFLANSMPIRDMDMYADHKGKPVVVQGHRGASGIDGTIAAAAGFAVGLKQPVTLLVGDLAFLHDLNSLAMLAKLRTPVVVIVLNNNGGAIFSFLPIAEVEEWGPHRFASQSEAVGPPRVGAPKPGEIFEKYFAAPHGLTFEPAAGLFALDYFAPASPQDFVRSYQKALGQKKSSLIEIKTDRRQNHKIHQDLQKAIEVEISRS